MIIRTETRADHEKVYDVHRQAFGGREEESKLVERIRRTEQFVPELSLVAEMNDEIVGHALLSVAHIVNGEDRYEVLALAPIAVKPSHQREGIGGQLIDEGLRRGRERGYDAVFVIGHPTYYPRFGFVPAGPRGFELKQFEVPEDVFMVCELSDGALSNITGELVYPSTFME
ncbi:GNAT family N-acetyltransferase [Paenibacillus dendritiformis]|uniref:GNAT family N-acetyltransferase n=1 Tax=Paenibacillus dendritiformis TaxID=130049 RepID=UPI00364A7975